MSRCRGGSSHPLSRTAVLSKHVSDGSDGANTAWALHTHAASLDRAAHTTCTALESVSHCAHWGLASLSQTSPRSKSLHGPGPAESEPQLRGLENRAEPDPSPLLDQETRALRPSGSLKSALYSLGRAGFFVLSF